MSYSEYIEEKEASRSKAFRSGAKTIKGLARKSVSKKRPRISAAARKRIEGRGGKVPSPYSVGKPTRVSQAERKAEKAKELSTKRKNTRNIAGAAAGGAAASEAKDQYDEKNKKWYKFASFVSGVMED